MGWTPFPTCTFGTHALACRSCLLGPTHQRISTGLRTFGARAPAPAPDGAQAPDVQSVAPSASRISPRGEGLTGSASASEFEKPVGFRVRRSDRNGARPPSGGECERSEHEKPSGFEGGDPLPCPLLAPSVLELLPFRQSFPHGDIHHGPLHRGFPSFRLSFQPQLK